jgi:hypothetical protein
MSSKGRKVKARERRKWALELASALLRSDMDCFDPEEFEDEDEQDKRRDAVCAIADELEAKARRMRE